MRQLAGKTKKPNTHKKRDGQNRPFITTHRRTRKGAADGARSQRVIHVELDRMGGHAHARDFRHLEFYVGVDHGVGENSPLGQERAALVQVFQRLVQAVAYGGDQRIFFRWQVVQVLGGSLTRVDLVFTPSRPAISKAEKHR